jgi:hypothetical protein
MMAVDKQRLEEILNRLPVDLQNELIEFAEALINRSPDAQPPTSNGDAAARFRSMFGTWSSGDPHSCDNDRIDADLAREYENTHEDES